VKILFVAMSHSIHTVRWISQLHDQGWEIHLFPCYAISDINPELRHITLHHTVYTTTHGADRTIKHRGIRLWSPIKSEAIDFILKWSINRCFPNYRVNQLSKLIKKIKPDIVHSLEFQHAGYLTLEAKKRLGSQFPPWIVSSWGNDLYLYHRIEEHQEQLKALLAAANYYIADCKRDIPIAKVLGFNGEVLGAYIGGGGYRLDAIPKLETLPSPSTRKVILLKGYQHFTGRALFGLRALALCKDILKNYEIVIYFAGADVKIAAEVVAYDTGLNISFFANASHAQWIDLLSRARINIGVSISDGTPLSMLESLLVGTFPIQSYTACVDEWISDGKTGLIVEPEDPHAIAEAIRRALTDDELVDNAAQINSKIVAEQLDYKTIQSEVIDLYRRIAEKK
jgi:hypothetical protein